jgi:16S rRNA processing protein RimM
VRLELGRIGRAHGLRGELHIVPITNVPERFAPGSQLWVGNEPYVVATSRRHHDRVVVRFEGVDDRDSAERLRGSTVFGESLAAAPDGEVFVHELIGTTVVDRAGTELGRVVAVEANPAHDLLVLDGGALVPMVFVVAQEPGRVVVDVPDGLLEL